MEPASIRYKNPGAMWGNALAIKWGAAKKAVTLNDGKGQGNNIAVFPTYVQGICAQLDLWRTSKNYKNKRFADAIDTWDGHNSTEQYIAFVSKRVPGLTRNTVMNDAFWRGDMAIPFLKAQAWHEAGKRYPAPDEDWVKAHKRVLGGKTVPTGTGPVVTTAAAGGLWTFLEHHRLSIVLVGVVVVAAYVAYRVYKARKHRALEESTAKQPPTVVENSSQVEPEKASVPEAKTEEGNTSGVVTVVEVNNTDAPTEDNKAEQEKGSNHSEQLPIEHTDTAQASASSPTEPSTEAQSSSEPQSPALR